MHRLNIHGVSAEAPNTGGPSAAVLVPIYREDGAAHLIMIKRPMSMPTHAGDIAFPGGRPDPGDAGPVATALREAEEEVGIIPGDVNLLGFLPAVDTVQYRLPVVPVVGFLDGVPDLHPSEREVDRLFRTPLDELRDESAWRCEMWWGHPVWFFDLDGDVLWGATAWMVRELLGLSLSCQ
ncbi:MAG: CoA pyrophosphatase [Actinobacteria bacterium]|nr:CoA pyrophosphatase [Actinomycetota bacterium]